MSKIKKIPVHRMDDWFAGVYLKSFAAVNSSGKSYNVSEPHRHDFYFCVLVDKGKLELEVDFDKFKLHDQSLFLSYPGQIHQVNFANVERGWFLAIDPSILDEKLVNLLDQCLSEIILVPLSPGQSDGLYSLMDNLHTTYDDQAQMFRENIAHAMVTAFVYQLVSIYLSMEKFNLIRHSARSIEITKTFKQMVRRNFKTIKKPSEFAARMNIATTYLNDTVKLVTGFPVTYYIQQELMREAQRLLYYSERSVKEIANILGFEDEKYFNRLFRKVMGISPGAFKKKNETNIHL
jgi:AraC family transcriptional activator of pobA